MEITKKLFTFRKLEKVNERNLDMQLNQVIELKEQISECILLLERNETLFNMESEFGLIEAYIYEHESLKRRLSHLMRQAKLQTKDKMDIKI